ncbi:MULTISPECIES: DNA (cytosine-5-)-methyltransferase [Flavobacterium]|uniref:DNA (cytosine-5-)-methyltransferase n=1 Tax=Flavobacterium keumense TaxID=1306518 RepID=A0ABY8N4J6_9FLAO|nr:MULTISPECIES: DNA (cytosine-5-)-methyltransferase [Flavobacterium]WGK93781.1 DNA (cytosine-5-)-methyltransferase [Flavobacterium keumense]
MIKVGSDFSGVGAFNQALRRLKIPYDELFACDMDKYARQTFELNYGAPKDFPTDVYDREIPKQSLDIYMTSPPCQSFSLAGKRLGKEDKRGILFFNSLEFIQQNKPRYFIFENVKGLLSHDKVDPKAAYGRTFQEWINYLGGGSVNGVHTFFPIEDSVPYHIYFQVLNAKNYGIPQNRERIFIIGIRDDEDNNFQFPKPIPLEKRLKDVLESEVDKKYFLGEKTLDYFQKHLEYHKGQGNGFGFKPQSEEDTHANSLTTKYGSRQSDTYLKIGTWRTHEDGKGFRATEDNNCPTIPARAREDGSGQPVIKVNELSILGYTRDAKGKVISRHEKDISGTITTSSVGGGNTDQFVKIGANTSKGFDEAEEEDSINFSVPSSKTRRGRVGKKVSQTLDTQCNQGIFTQQRIRRLTPLECFRLMDFNEDFKWNVSDSQAYKQAGNSICVGVLAAIISKLKL